MEFYYNSICHVCKTYKPELKRCGSCKCMAYCGKEHQRDDWKEHKDLCRVIKQSHEIIKCNQNVSYEDWRSYRVALQKYWSDALDRSLKEYEQQMWMFPRACAVCYSTEELKDCNECLSVQYCSEEHKNKDEQWHSQFCKDLKLSLFLNTQLKESKRTPNVENVLKDISKKLEDYPDTAELISTLPIVSHEDLLTQTILTETLAPHFTILYGLEKANLIINRKLRSEQKSLTIHIVGADNSEVMVFVTLISKINIFKLWIKDLTSTKLILIGPDLPDVIEDHHEAHVECYKETYTKELIEKLDKPNLVVCFNSGLHEFEGTSLDTWGPSVEYLVWYPHVPVLLTGYTGEEISKDIQRIFNLEGVKLSMVLEKTDNPFKKGLRPIRDWDSRNKVFFLNGFVAILQKEK